MFEDVLAVHDRSNRVCRRRRARPRQCFRCGSSLSIAGEGERSARRSGYLRAEGHRKGSALARRDGHR